MKNSKEYFDAECKAREESIGYPFKSEFESGYDFATSQPKHIFDGVAKAGEVSDNNTDWYTRLFYEYCRDFFACYPSLKSIPDVYRYIRKQKTVNVDGKVYPLEEAIALLEGMR